MAEPHQSETQNCSANNVSEIGQYGSMVWRITNGLHRYLCAFIRLLIVLFRGERGESMPPIDDQLLLEPATSIAEKIRTKQVNSAQEYTFVL